MLDAVLCTQPPNAALVMGFLCTEGKVIPVHGPGFLVGPFGAYAPSFLLARGPLAGQRQDFFFASWL